MDKYSLYVSNFLPCKEYFSPELNQACPGCGLALAVRQTYKALGMSIEKGAWASAEHGKAGAAGSGLFGTGATDVTFLTIPKVRGKLVICCDNEAGGSLSDLLEKPMPQLAASQGFSYVATACPSYPFDLYDKMKRAFKSTADAYVHVLCPCPPGWNFDADFTVKLGRLAVESRAFPLYEAGAGAYGLTVKTVKPRPLADYLKAQGRFEKLSDGEMAEAQASVDRAYKNLEGLIQQYLDAVA
jgi:pyruvate/2-oxoacid:ferredoxin oxidoreductase beta subunit